MALFDQYLLHLELRDTLSGKLLGISRTGQQLTEKLTGGQRRVQQAFRQTSVSAGRLQSSLTGTEHSPVVNRTHLRYRRGGACGA